MKRSEMKSTIAVQSKCRPEGRLFPRRKVAAKSHLLNGTVGDFDMELSLAIQESLRYAQQNEHEQESNVMYSNSSQEETNKREILHVSNYEVTRDSSCNKALVPMASTSCCWASEEVGRLKDLILTQAEFIQCQQEEIHEGKKELQTLKSSNDALQCRLERMERRMSILKQKEEVHDGCVSPDETELKMPGSSHSVLVKGSFESTHLDNKMKRRRGPRLGQKQLKCPIQRKRNKYSRTVVTTADGELSKKESGNESDNAEVSDESNSENDNEQDETDEESKGSAVEDHDNSDDQGSDVEEKVIDYQIMETEAMYHLYYPKHVFSCLESKMSPEKVSQSDVETPTWRLKPLTNMYQLEGTENITDEAYFKRHQKFEMEEKRRKRWDMQRIRELRLIEKVQKQKEDEIRASQDEADVETFLPSIQDLMHIEVTESVPVMAFGQPVPFVSPAEFEIPWDMSSSVQSSSARPRNNSHSRRH